MVVGQKVALGRIHQHQTVTVLVADTTLTVKSADGDTRTICRTTTQPVRSIKGQRPRTATSVSYTMCRKSDGRHVSRISRRITGLGSQGLGSQGSDRKGSGPKAQGTQKSSSQLAKLTADSRALVRAALTLHSRGSAHRRFSSALWRIMAGLAWTIGTSGLTLWRAILARDY